jgi:hypothetical protein
MKSKVKEYLRGNLRLKIYQSKFKFLLRTHIKEQFKFRTLIMNKECYEQGSCVSCGCTVPNLQMSNSSCDNDCYPPMMSRGDWHSFMNKKKIDGWKITHKIDENKTKITYYVYRNNKLFKKRTEKLLH